MVVLQQKYHAENEGKRFNWGIFFSILIPGYVHVTDKDVECE